MHELEKFTVKRVNICALLTRMYSEFLCRYAQTCICQKNDWTLELEKLNIPDANLDLDANILCTLIWKTHPVTYWAKHENFDLD